MYEASKSSQKLSSNCCVSTQNPFKFIKIVPKNNLKKIDAKDMSHMTHMISPKNHGDNYNFQMALNVLTKIANDSSLRYAIQLITPAWLHAKRRKAKQVGTEDIRKCYTLFLDEKRSTDYLKEYEEHFLYGNLSDKTARMEVA